MKHQKLSSLTLSAIMACGMAFGMSSLAHAKPTGEAGTATSHAKNFISPTYMKPGAPISYSHNLTRPVDAGEAVTFQLRLNEAYDGGYLNVTVEAEGDLTLYSGTSQTQFDMGGEGGSHLMNVSFTAGGNGRYYLNVRAQAEAIDGQSGQRYFSIPVQVGPLAPSKPKRDFIRTKTGENIIVMDAEETIK